MIRNIFLGAVVIAIAFVGFQIYNVSRVRSALSDVGASYRSGPESANLEVVEFLDYACPYCREIHPTITEAVRRDGNVAFIPRPVAFLGEASAYAALVAYAAAEQGKFFDMHDLIIRDFEQLSESTLPQFSAAIGADVETLSAAIKGGNLQDKVLENMDLFEALGTNATPTFIIGGKTIYVPEGTMPSVDDFLDMFAKARGKAQ